MKKYIGVDNHFSKNEHKTVGNRYRLNIAEKGGRERGLAQIACKGNVIHYLLFLKFACFLHIFSR